MSAQYIASMIAFRLAERSSFRVPSISGSRQFHTLRRWGSGSGSSFCAKINVRVPKCDMMIATIMPGFQASVPGGRFVVIQSFQPTPAGKRARVPGPRSRFEYDSRARTSRVAICYSLFKVKSHFLPAESLTWRLLVFDRYRSY